MGKLMPMVILTQRGIKKPIPKRWDLNWLTLKNLGFLMPMVKTRVMLKNLDLKIEK